MKRYFIYVLIAVCYLSGIAECNSTSTGSPDPCQSFTILHSANRKHTIQENRGNCDRGLAEGWYKLEIGGIPAEIPTACLKNNVCGTQLPLRINLEGRNMPTVGNIMDAYVCTSFNVLGQWDCCVLRQRVRIKNCRNFYVYHLKPTDRCPVAYCAQDIGENPAHAVTRKRGDHFNGPVSNPASTTSIETTPLYSNITSTADTIIEQTHTTETTDSPSMLSARQNSTEISTTEAVVSNVTGDTTGITTSMEGIVSTTGDANVTTSENVTDITTADSHVNVSEALPTVTTDTSQVTVVLTTADADAFSHTANNSDISTTERTVANATATQNTGSNLVCKNWPQVPCPDNITTCYNSPENNQMYIACDDDSRCGIICDYFPDCNDSSDEASTTCPPIRLCLEGQRLCSDGSACYSRCDGHIQCNIASVGEDEDNCPTKPTTSNYPDVTSIPDNVTDIPETSTLAFNLTSTHAAPTGTEANANATESATDSVNITESGTRNTTESSDRYFTDSFTSVENNTVAYTNLATVHTSLVTEQTTSGTAAENFTVPHSSASTNESVTTNVSSFSQTTDRFVENVTDMLTTRGATSESMQVSSTDADRDNNITTGGVTARIDTVITEGQNVSVSEVSLTTTPGNYSRISDVTNTNASGVSEFRITTAATSEDVYTSVGEQATTHVGTTKGIVETTQGTEILSTAQEVLISQSTEEIQKTTLVTGDSSVSRGLTELPTESTSISHVTTMSITSSPEVSLRQTTPEMTSTESVERLTSETTAPSDQSLSTVTMDITQSSASKVTTDASASETITLAPSTTESTPTNSISTTSSATTEISSSITDYISSAEVEVQSTGHADLSTKSNVRKVTTALSDASSPGEVTTLLEAVNASAEYHSVTGPQPTSSGDNQTDRTVALITESKGLIFENFGLFVFLVVAAAVIVGICIFGLLGYTYRRRLRSWNPAMAYQDAYGDMEKTTLSYGRDKYGIESPIPDFDILRDEKNVEETSLSQASTLVLAPTPGRSEPPFDDTVDEGSPGRLTNGTPAHEVSQQNNEVSYIGNGQTNEGFGADDNVDGIVPVDDLDTSLPRALFPWIENAADTKL